MAIVNEQQLTQLSEYLVDGALYVPFVLETTVALSNDVSLKKLIPSMVSQCCDTCGLQTKWDLDSDHEYTRHGDTTEISFKCRNCGERVFKVWIIWSIRGNKVTFIKGGQLPEFQIAPPKELVDALGKEGPALYRKGLISRHQGYGLGAHAYFRRLVEDTIDDMLDAVIVAMTEAGSEAGEIQKVSDIKKARAFEDKVKLVADILPRALRPGGANPFAILHGLLSKGLHSLTEAECLEIVDGMKEVLEYVFIELKTHTEKRKAYATGLHALQSKLADKKKKPAEQ